MGVSVGTQWFIFGMLMQFTGCFIFRSKFERGYITRLMKSYLVHHPKHLVYSGWGSYFFYTARN